MILCSLFIVVALYAYYKIDKYFHDQRIDDVSKRCVLVTGCDTGFGAVLPVRLDAYGVTCFAGCLTQDGVDRLKEKCSDNVKPLLLDVTDSENIQKAYDYVKNNIPAGKEFWAVLNNAGYNGPGGPMEFMTKDDYKRVFDINFFGPTEVARIFLPLLKQAKGRIVNVASCGGRLAMTMNHPYFASKYAMEGFSDAIRREKAIYGVSVAIIEPGGFRTALFDYDAWVRMKETQWQNLPEDVRKEYGEEFFSDLKTQRVRLTKNFTKTDLTPVVDAYVDALFSKYPRLRYMVGWDSMLYCYVGMLPGSVADLFVAYMLKPPRPKALRSN